MSSRSSASFNLLLRIATLLLAIVVPLAFSRSAAAGDAIVNINQHQTEEFVPGQGDSCADPDTCPQNQATPLNNAGQDSMVSGNAYHVKSECEVARARCKYNHHNKTVILSSDLGAINPNLVKDWIQAIEGTDHETGQIHFEHWDRCLTNWLLAGNSVSDFNSLPSNGFCAAMQPPDLVGTRSMLQWIRDSSDAGSETLLLQNGWLHRQTSSLRKLRWKAWDAATSSWKSDPVRLVGLGFMGALSAAPDRLVVRPYFRTLRAHNVNLHRVWAIEQWTAQAGSTEGAMPFTGTLGNQLYDLANDNSAFYERLRLVAQESADRGIVTQLSLFDKHGLICDTTANPGQYVDSPYRNARNVMAQNYLADSIPGCNCSGSSGLNESSPPVDCHPLDAFIDNTLITAVHKRFVHRIGEEVGGVGNIVFEVINEALAPSNVGDYQTPGDWPSQVGNTTKNQQWQKDIAREIRLAAPLPNAGGSINVARDAFNGEGTSPVGLGAKRSDLAESAWYNRPAGTNAKVQFEYEEEDLPSLGPSRTFGYVTSQGFQGVSDMASHLSIASTSNWSKVQVRADIAVNSGFLELGIGATNGNNVYVRINSVAGLIELFKIGTCMIQSATCLIGSAAYTNPAAIHNVRLRVDRTNLTAGTASVYVDGVAVPGLQAVALDVLPSYDRGFFRGWNGSTPYVPGSAKLDNFEVARFCTNTAQPFLCNP